MKRLCILILIFLTVAMLPAKATESYLWPVEGFYNISSGFGKRTSGMHRGIDITGPRAGWIAKAAVRAAKSGTVSAVHTGCVHNYPKSQSCGCGGGYGNFVYITHADGSVARYAHLGDATVLYGQSIRQGQEIGTVGSTGSSAGFHLHFELRSPQGEAQNTMPVNSGERHTYYGSSAPFSEAIAYFYDEAAEVVTEDGKIRVQVPALSGGRILVVQYAGGRLLGLFAAGQNVSSVEVPVSEGADSAKVLVWRGVFPVQEAVFLRL